MKIYTRTGDEGMTGLFGGPRVRKDDSLIEAYGTVDELNSVLGLVREALGEEGDEPEISPLYVHLKRIQHELFDVGADLATPLDAKAQVNRVRESQISRLEQNIDELDARLPALKQFILPGGSKPAAYLHLARTVCRRAERRAILAGMGHDINPHVTVFLNRLSDYLFVAAREANRVLETDDETWSQT